MSSFPFSLFRCVKSSLLKYVVLLLLFLNFVATQAIAENKKVALVIGNNDYSHTPRLKNALNDAQAIARALESIKFKVILAENLGKSAFNDILERFSRETADSEISLIYYAGHGIQIEGNTYVVPTDARLESRDDIGNLIPAERILSNSARSEKVSIVILDACRDNPLSRSLSEAIGMARPNMFGQGLARIENVPGNTLIAYATRAGNVALDGLGSNSPYAQAIVKNITHPDRDIRMVFGSVRDDVLDATSRIQEPFIYGSLGGNPIYLNRRDSSKNSGLSYAIRPDLVSTTASIPVGKNEVVPLTSEAAIWQSAKQQNDWALVEQTRIEYPETVYGIVSEILLNQKETRKDISVAEAVNGLMKMRVDITSLPTGVVRSIQRKLSTTNYYSGTIDGASSTSTRNAMYAFVQDTYNGGFISYHSILALTEIADYSTVSSDLSGSWKGRFYYPRPLNGLSDVGFEMNLVLSQGNIYGRITEANTFGRKTSKNLYAIFHGKIDGNNIAWKKTYDGTGGVNHSVIYSGKLNRKNRRIEGRWSIAGSWSGRFYIELQ